MKTPAYGVVNDSVVFFKEFSISFYSNLKGSAPAYKKSILKPEIYIFRIL